MFFSSSSFAANKIVFPFISFSLRKYLKQISLVGGIPFSIVLPKAANSVNADMMSVTQIHQKLEKGYADIEKGNVEDAASAFVAFRERH